MRQLLRQTCGVLGSADTMARDEIEVLGKSQSPRAYESDEKGLAIQWPDAHQPHVRI